MRAANLGWAEPSSTCQPGDRIPEVDPCRDQRRFGIHRDNETVGSEMGDLADAYLRYNRRSRAEAAMGRKLDPQDADAEAIDRVLDFGLTDDVESLWAVNIELIRRCQSIDELSFLAAGPVED